MKSKTAGFSLLLFILAGVTIFSLERCSVPAGRGEILYQQNCMSCHGKEGEGLRNLIPPLAGADYLKENRERLACIIRYGQKGEVVVNGRMYNYPMPGNKELSVTEIVNIMNYVGRAWGNDEKLILPEQVEEQLDSCQE